MYFNLFSVHLQKKNEEYKCFRWKWQKTLHDIWQSCSKVVLAVGKKLEDGVGNNDHNIKSSKSIKSFWCEVELDKTWDWKQK
jgi:hypothetical protein